VGWTPPGSDYAFADEAVAWCAFVGMELDDWQQYLLREMLAERPARPEDGETPGFRWAARTAAMVISRQNGKGKVTHTAHEVATADKHFARMRHLCGSHRELRRRLLPISPRTGESKSFSFGNGEAAIELAEDPSVDLPPTIEFRTRTGRLGRGFSGDLLVFDEATFVSAAQANALVPTMSAKPNPQLIYAGSAVDAREHPEGETLTRVRNRALAGGEPSLFYAEWSAEGSDPDKVDVHDEQAIAQANPALGYRLTWPSIEGERPDLTRRGFAVERMSVGDWPVVHTAEAGVLDYDRWQTLAVPATEPLTDPVCIGVDSNPLRTMTTIAVAGWTPSRRLVVEVVERRSGTTWVVDRLLELVARWDPCAIVLDAKGSTAALLPKIRKANLDPAVTTYLELVEACSGWVDKLNDGVLGHRGDPRLDDAVRTAQRRGASDQMLFARAKGGEDIAPLMAGALAGWGLERFGDPPPAVGLPASDPLDDRSPAGAVVGLSDLATIGF